MKTFSGFRTDGEAHVVVTEYADDRTGKTSTLDCHNDWRDHSPTGPEWGYGGSGPAQLALGILGALYPQDVAMKFYQNFKFEVIAAIKTDTWELTEGEVRAKVEKYIANEKLHFFREDNDNCRVYYRRTSGALYCYQNEGRGDRVEFWFYACSKDGEPSYRTNLPDLPDPPPGETKIGQELVAWMALEAKDAAEAAAAEKAST